MHRAMDASRVAVEGHTRDELRGLMLVGELCGLHKTREREVYRKAADDLLDVVTNVHTYKKGDLSSCLLSPDQEAHVLIVRVKKDDKGGDGELQKLLRMRYGGQRTFPLAQARGAPTVPALAHLCVAAVVTRMKRDAPVDEVEMCALRTMARGECGLGRARPGDGLEADLLGREAQGDRPAHLGVLERGLSLEEGGRGREREAAVRGAGRGGPGRARRTAALGGGAALLVPAVHSSLHATAAGDPPGAVVAGAGAGRERGGGARAGRVRERGGGGGAPALVPGQVKEEVLRELGVACKVLGRSSSR